MMAQSSRTPWDIRKGQYSPKLYMAAVCWKNWIFPVIARKAETVQSMVLGLKEKRCFKIWGMTITLCQGGIKKGPELTPVEPLYDTLTPAYKQHASGIMTRRPVVVRQRHKFFFIPAAFSV
tara:strand:- start:1253 stop:1615 length:363 start_codon:yes stop_codon:yes gene_type:complete